MNTDQLILTLVADLKPVSHHALIRRLCIGLLLGTAGAAILVAVRLGFRPDLVLALQGFHFWMKWAYTMSLGIGSIFAIERLARPTSSSLHGLWLLGLPVLGLATIGIVELAETPARQWLSMWLGQSWMMCPWWVLILALPIFVSLLWSFRKFAPTRLRAAGAAAGFAAGAWAAAVYCLHCPEDSAIFVLTWYSLGILLATGLGALLGSRILRW